MDVKNSADISKRDLRSFGLIMALMIGLIFGVLLPWLWSGQYRTWPWIAGALFALPALVCPAVLKWPYIAWMKIGGVLGRVNTVIILGLAYVFVFTPIGLILRLIGKDTLMKRWRENVQSYRVVKSARPSNHVERQF